MNSYQIDDLGQRRILTIGDKKYETLYSRKVIELIIKRKGLGRTPAYFAHKEKRNYLLVPLFNYLNSNGYKDLRVLEVGCSAGQLTELLNEQGPIGEIYAYDVDNSLVEVVKAKVQELGLKKVKKLDSFSNQKTLRLPYEDNFFDLIIVSGVVEHLPFENRYMYVDEYYRKLKVNGLICFLDTPNRNYLFETHSVGLPFISKLPAQAAFIYARLFGRLKGVDFPGFVRAGTGWRNATYYECLPRTMLMAVRDISEEAGYGYLFYKGLPQGIKARLFILPIFGILRQISLRLGFPLSFFLPYLNIVLKKIHDFEPGNLQACQESSGEE